MNYDELRAALQKDFPQYLALLDMPGIFGVFDQIYTDLANGKPWTQAQIEYALEGTDYYKNTPKTERQWDVLRLTDPATANQMASEAADKLKLIAKNLGVELTPELEWTLVGDALRGQWSDSEIRQNFINAVKAGGSVIPATGVGNTQGARSQITQLAKQYGVTLGSQAIDQWALGLQDGSVTQDGLQAYLIEQAKSLYPGLAGALDSGITVRQYADPYVQLAVKELGINPNDFDLADPKWGAALQQVDAQGNRTALTLQSWQSRLRSDPIYGYDMTTGARDQAAQFAGQIAQTFGAM